MLLTVNQEQSIQQRVRANPDKNQNTTETEHTY